MSCLEHPWTPKVRPKSFIFLPKWDDEHLSHNITVWSRHLAVQMLSWVIKWSFINDCQGCQVAGNHHKSTPTLCVWPATLLGYGRRWQNQPTTKSCLKIFWQPWAVLQFFCVRGFIMIVLYKDTKHQKLKVVKMIYTVSLFMNTNNHNSELPSKSQ